MSGNTEVLNKANHILAPANSRSFAYAATSTQSSMDLSSFKGQWVSLVADGAAIYIMAADTAANAKLLDDTQVTAGDGAPSASNTNQCTMIASGGRYDFVVDISKPIVGFKCASGASGKIRGSVSSQKHGSEA